MRSLGCFRILIVLFLWLAGAWQAGAASIISETDPERFFNTLAGRQLSLELKVDINRIQLWPTNQYTAPVHRLLQLSANIFDCTSNSPASRAPYLPSVFRPLCTNDSGVIYISGFAAADDAEILSRPRLSLDNAEDRAALTPDDIVEGIPFVIAVKKGLPNFNQFVSETTLHASRRLEFLRQDFNGPIKETNQMHVFTLTNHFGVELWNPYQAPFARSVKIGLMVSIDTVMTNSTGSMVFSNAQNSSAQLAIPAGSWQGCTNINEPGPSFIIPVITNSVLLPPSQYTFSRQLNPLTAQFERTGAFPVPDLWLQQRVRLNYVIVDLESNRIIDYVSLKQPGISFNVPWLLMSYPDHAGYCRYPYIPSGHPQSLWCTNRFGGLSIAFPTFGVLNQIPVSQGRLESPEWPTPQHLVAIDFFRAQFDMSPLYYPESTFQKTSIFYAPFTPSRTLVFPTWWETMDPLVHYTTAALTPWNFGPILLGGSFGGGMINIGRVNRGY